MKTEHSAETCSNLMKTYTLHHITFLHASCGQGCCHWQEGMVDNTPFMTVQASSKSQAVLGNGFKRNKVSARLVENEILD